MQVKLISLILAYSVPFILYLILRYQRISIATSVVKSILIMTIQLGISVVLLTLVFKTDNLLITLLYLLVMSAFSFKTLNSRVDKNYQHKQSSMLAIVIASFSALVILLLFLSVSGNVLTPRYIIPVFGMILGNTTTAVVLGSNEVHKILENNRNIVLNLTNLGVPTKVALNEQLKVFVVIALTPVLTSMLNIGVVSLPGMMSGQILAGELPTNAVAYQIMIMLSIFSSSAIAILYLKHRVVKNSINDKNQLL